MKIKLVNGGQWLAQWLWLSLLGVLRGVSERGRGARVYRGRQRKDLRGHRRHSKDLGFYSGLVRSHWGPLRSKWSFDASSTASPIFPREMFGQGIENRHIIPF